MKLPPKTPLFDERGAPHMPKGISIANIGLRSFLTAFVILAALMVLAYVLCFAIPAGEYQREIVDGQTFVIPGSYSPVQGGLAPWRWLLSPFLCLSAAGGGLMAAIIAFLLIIGGVFSALEHSGILAYMLGKLAHRFRSRRRFLLFLVPLLFMSLGAFIGSFEECIPLVPIAISLALAMGWDAMMGLAMSLLAVGCGFSTGVLNPYTVGVAQTLAGLPMFSGIGLRIVSFVLIYALLMAFLTAYAKKLEKPGAQAPAAEEPDFEESPAMDKALRAFVIIIGAGVALIFASVFSSLLADLVLILTALMFVAAGLVAVPLSGAGWGKLGRWVLAGFKGIAPAAVLILMAGSIRYTLEAGRVMDTILYEAVNIIEHAPKGLAILAVYVLVLLLEFAIASGSAKAFLLMPLITPVADMVGISRQLSVLAFAYGDGFSNVFYPTNPGLLICLSIAGVSFGKWMRFTWKMQLGILGLTAALLMLGLASGY